MPYSTVRQVIILTVHGQNFFFLVHRVTTRGAAVTFYSNCTVQYIYAAGAIYCTVIVIVVDPTPAIDQTIRPQKSISLRRRQTKHKYISPGPMTQVASPSQKQKTRKRCFGHSNNLPLLLLLLFLLYNFTVNIWVLFKVASIKSCELTNFATVLEQERR